MAAEVGSSSGNGNQAALEEQRRKQQEEAQKQEEAQASSDSSDSTEQKSKPEAATSEANSSNSTDQTLSTSRPGSSNNPTENSTTEKAENNLESSMPKDPLDSPELLTEELFSSISQTINETKERIENNPANEKNNPNSVADHLGARTDTVAFAAQQLRIQNTRNNEDQTRLNDDRQTQAAYQEIKTEAQRLIEDGHTDQAKELLRQVYDKPESLRSVAEQVKAERLSPQSINLKLSSELDLAKTESLQDMQATQYAKMTREEQKDHTLELMAGLMTTLDESAANFIRNESILSALSDNEKPLSSDPLNPFESLLKQDNNPFSLDSIRSSHEALQSSRENFLYGEGTSKASDEGLSLLVRHGGNPDEAAIKSELEAREILRETQIKQRETLLTAQGNAVRLAQADRADQIHLLFDGKGNPLDRDSIKERGSYNSGLSDELEGQYRDLNEFLNRDQSLEAGFSELQESSIGLSAEEQTVKARDFLTDNLQNQRETLRTLQGLTPELDSIIRGKDSSALERLTAADQQIISNLTQEALAKRADIMIGLHDQLTESVNSANYEQGIKSIEEMQERLKDGLYTYQRNELSDRELVNRDLARTPQEDEAIQKRITTLEKEFEALTDEQLNIVSGNSRNNNKDLEEFKSLNEIAPLGLFEAKGWRKISGEADILMKRIDAGNDHNDAILDSLLTQQRNIQSANSSMAEAGQLERYERKLEGIIDEARVDYQSAGAKGQSELSAIKRQLQGIDSFYSNTETGLKLARNAAVIAGVTLATGGAGTALVGAGWGATSAGFAAFGAGTAYGAGVSLLSNTAEGLSRHGNGFTNPYENVLSKTWQDTKTSASVAAATATGMNLTKALSETYKWGRLTSSITGAGASGIVSTNVTYGLNAAEQKLTTGEVDINGKQYLKDLLWNTGTSMVGGAIGGKFGQWQDGASSTASRFGLIATEELASISTDLGLTYARDGEITAEGLLQTFQASITGRAQAHFAHQGTGPRNELAQQIRNQETVVKSSGELPDGVEAKTKVRVEPDGSRKVEVDAREDVMRRAMEGDVDAQKTMLEETVGHARENPIDPQVKQADGSYKAMTSDKYHALRARQELAMRSVAEAKFADAQGTSVSATKQDSKTTLAEMNQAIKNNDFTKAMEIAEAKGIGETYREQFDADYKKNANRNRETEALEQTSFHKAFGPNPETRVKAFDSSDSRVDKSDIESIITKSDDPALTRQILDEASQFTSLNSINEISNLVKSLGDEYSLITDGKGGLADLLNYAQKKAEVEGQESNSQKPQISSVKDLNEVDLELTKLQQENPDLKGVALILDPTLIKRLESDPQLKEALQTLKDEHALDVKFINPQGWSNGINAFSSKDALARNVAALETQVKDLMTQNPGLARAKAVEQALNSKARELVADLGFEQNSLVTAKNKEMPETATATKLAERFQDGVIDEKAFNQHLKDNSDGYEMKEALRSVWENGFRAVGLKDMAEFAQSQHSNIQKIAASNNIDPKDIYYLMPEGSDVKSNQYAANIYHSVNDTDPGNIIKSMDDIPPELRDDSMIVLLDDNSLSGETQLKSYVGLIDQGYEGHIAVAPSVSSVASDRLFSGSTPSKQSQETIDTTIKKVRKRSHHIREDMTPEDVDFILEARDQSKLHSVPGMVHETYKETSAYKNLDEASKKQVDSLFLNQGGYNGTGTGLVFPFMSPNNNLRIFAESGLLEMFTLDGKGIKGVRE